MSGKINFYCAHEEIYLPNEILTIIINDLASDAEDNDRTLAALASCRLASHVLHSLATPLLFSSIQLVNSIPAFCESLRYNSNLSFKKRATKLKQILTSSNIAALVHTLKLRLDLEDRINSTLVSEILHRLPHLRTFILKSGRACFNFNAMKRDLALAIESLCRSPILTTLELGNIFGYPNPIDETSMQRYLNLDSLEIDEDSIDSLGVGISGLSGDIHLAKHFSRIRNLRLKDLFFYRNTTFKNGWKIMLMASQSLTTLDLARANPIHRYITVFPVALESGPFDLGLFPALRYFKIEIRISPRENATMLSFLNQLLSISSSTSSIETLEIIITWDYVKSECQEDLFASDAGWSTLAEVLSPEKFVSLKKVVLGLSFEIQWRRDHSKAYYHNQMNLEVGRRSTPPYVNALFSMFRAMTSTQCTLELHVEDKALGS